MDLKQIYSDIILAYDEDEKSGKGLNVYRFKKYTYTEHEGKNSDRLISSTFKIEKDKDNFIEIDFDCKDGSRTFEIRPDSNRVTVSLTIDGKKQSSGSYAWLARH